MLQQLNGEAEEPAIGVCDFPNNIPGCGLVQSTTQQPTTQPSSSLSIDRKCLSMIITISVKNKLYKKCRSFSV